MHSPVIRFLRVYLLPGAVMQSVMIGGAYGTGREMTQYFTQHGMLGGTLGLGVAAVFVAIVFALSIELSRRFLVFDYRSFARVLLGRAWFLFELVAISLLLLVIAVITAASGTLMADQFGVPGWLGSSLTLAAVVLLIVAGRPWVVAVLASWSLLLYVVFAVYLLAVFLTLEPTAASRASEVRDGWFVSGLQYAMYNISAIPLVLYACRSIETRRQAFVAGTVGAVIAFLPALMLHVSFAVDYPSIIGVELPVYHILGLVDLRWVTAFYLLVIFGTFVETAAGIVQGVVERVNGALLENGRANLKRWQHGTIAALIMFIALGMSSFGLIALVAKGYGAMAWGFMAFYALPLITIGVYKLYIAPDAK